MQINIIILRKYLFTRIRKQISYTAPTYKQYFYHIIFLSCKMCIFTSFHKVQTGSKSQSYILSNQVFMRFHDNRLVSCRGRQTILLSLAIFLEVFNLLISHNRPTNCCYMYSIHDFYDISVISSSIALLRCLSL